MLRVCLRHKCVLWCAKMSTNRNTAKASGDAIIVSVRMPLDEADRLREAAKRDERSMSFLARKAVTTYLDEMESAA